MRRVEIQARAADRPIIAGAGGPRTPASERRLRGTPTASSYRFLTAVFAAAAVFGALAIFVAGRLASDVAAGALALPAFEVEAAEAFLAGATFAVVLAPGGHTPLASLGAAEALMTASLKPLSGVIFAFLDALTFTGAPVAGFLAMRAGRSTRANLAKQPGPVHRRRARQGRCRSRRSW